MKQKWIFEGETGVFFPISASVKLHPTPGPGVYKVVKSPNPRDNRLGLQPMGMEKFEFPGKVYDLGMNDMIGKIKKTWEAEQFKKGKKNLTVVLNGLKGSGKTYMAKMMANDMDLPTLIVDNDFEGDIISFLSDIEFECTVLIDEAEKIFNRDNGNSHILLRLLDGIFNGARKFIILTTNTFTIDDNLVGRPGRVRYVKKFSSLPLDTVLEIIDDELEDKSKKNYVKEIVERLSISTVDVVRSIIEEVNIHGEVDNNIFSIPFAPYSFDVISIPRKTRADIPQIKEIFDKYGVKPGITMAELDKEIKVSKTGKDEDLCTYNLIEIIEWEIYNHGYCSYFTAARLKSNFPTLFPGSDTSFGEILEAPDKDGFFTYREAGGSDIRLGWMLGNRVDPLLYGKLI